MHAAAATSMRAIRALVPPRIAAQFRSPFAASASGHRDAADAVRSQRARHYATGLGHRDAADVAASGDNGLLTVDALRRAVAAEHKAENAKGGLDTVIVACPSRFC